MSFTNPSAPPTWCTAETVYPGSGQAWSGQPVAVAPANDYFQPSPATGSTVKLTAENLNYILQQITGSLGQLAGNGTIQVANLTAMRALPVPTYNQTVLLTPENNGAQVYTTAVDAAIGGLYFFDYAFTGADDSMTCVQPSAVVGSNPGRWRLQRTPFTVVADMYGYSGGGGPTFGTASTTGAAAYFSSLIILPLSIPAGLQLNDVIDIEATVYVIQSGTISTTMQFQHYTGGIYTSIGPSFSVAATGFVPMRHRYAVTSADLSGFSLGIAITGTSGSGGSSATNLTSFITQRRP